MSAYPNCTCYAPDDAEPEDHDLSCPENPTPADACVFEGTVWPDHDFGRDGIDFECLRCGAEVES